MQPIMPTTRLTDHDRKVLDVARGLAQVTTIAQVRELFPGWADDAGAFGEAFSHARYAMTELADALERLSRDQDAASGTLL